MDQSSLDRLSDEQFRRLTGLKRPMFQKMIQVLHASQRRRNRMLSSTRVVVENVIRFLKRFHILTDRYRNRRKRFGLRFNLIAAIYNQELIL